MSEVYRVLCGDGRFIILPAAWIVGRKLIDRSAAWLFKITGQAPVLPLEHVTNRLRRPMEQAGFTPQFQIIEFNASLILIVVAVK